MSDCATSPPRRSIVRRRRSSRWLAHAEGAIACGDTDPPGPEIRTEPAPPRSRAARASHSLTGIGGRPAGATASPGPRTASENRVAIAAGAAAHAGHRRHRANGSASRTSHGSSQRCGRRMGLRPRRPRDTRAGFPPVRPDSRSRSGGWPRSFRPTPASDGAVPGARHRPARSPTSARRSGCRPEPGRRRARRHRIRRRRDDDGRRARPRVCPRLGRAVLVAGGRSRLVSAPRRARRRRREPVRPVRGLERLRRPAVRYPGRRPRHGRSFRPMQAAEGSSASSPTTPSS